MRAGVRLQKTQCQCPFSEAGDRGKGSVQVADRPIHEPVETIRAHCAENMVEFEDEALTGCPAECRPEPLNVPRELFDRDHGVAHQATPFLSSACTRRAISAV